MDRGSAPAPRTPGQTREGGLSSPYAGEEAHSQGLACKPRCAKAGGGNGIKAQDF